MKDELIFSQKINYDQLSDFLAEIDRDFKPALSSRISLEDYAHKLLSNALIFAYSDDSGKIIGAIILYCNDKTREHAYIPVVGVIPGFRGLGITKKLFEKVEEHLRANEFQYLSLETWLGGDALAFYIKNGFFIHEALADRPDGGISLKLRKRLQLKYEAFDFPSTPLINSERLDRQLGVNLFLKRDDLFTATGGGSKARKLHYILKKAQEQGCNAVVTAGGSQSNHVRATALMCASLGMKMTAVIHDQKPLNFTGNLKVTAWAGAKIAFVQMNEVKKVMDQEVANYIAAGDRPFYIWGGGHSVEGAFAYYKAVSELKDQLGDVEPDYVVVASGTGTTQAGLEVGVRELFPRCRVLGVSVARDRERGTKVVIDSANELISALKSPLEPLENIHFDDTKMGNGYEDTFPELLEVITSMAKNHGLILDPTYSGKAFYGLTHYIKNGTIPTGSTVIFWHTGSLMNALASTKI